MANTSAEEEKRIKLLDPVTGVHDDGLLDSDVNPWFVFQQALDIADTTQKSEMVTKLLKKHKLTPFGKVDIDFSKLPTNEKEYEPVRNFFTLFIDVISRVDGELDFDGIDKVLKTASDHWNAIVVSLSAPYKSTFYANLRNVVDMLRILKSVTNNTSEIRKNKKFSFEVWCTLLEKFLGVGKLEEHAYTKYDSETANEPKDRQFINSKYPGNSQVVTSASKCFYGPGLIYRYLVDAHKSRNFIIETTRSEISVVTPVFFTGTSDERRRLDTKTIGRYSTKFSADYKPGLYMIMYSKEVGPKIEEDDKDMDFGVGEGEQYGAYEEQRVSFLTGLRVGLGRAHRGFMKPFRDLSGLFNYFKPAASSETPFRLYEHPVNDRTASLCSNARNTALSHHGASSGNSKPALDKIRTMGAAEKSVGGVFLNKNGDSPVRFHNGGTESSPNIDFVSPIPIKNRGRTAPISTAEIVSQKLESTIGANKEIEDKRDIFTKFSDPLSEYVKVRDASRQSMRSLFSKPPKDVINAMDKILDDQTNSQALVSTMVSPIYSIDGAVTAKKLSLDYKSLSDCSQKSGLMDFISNGAQNTVLSGNYNLNYIEGIPTGEFGENAAGLVNKAIAEAKAGTHLASGSAFIELKDLLQSGYSKNFEVVPGMGTDMHAELEPLYLSDSLNVTRALIAGDDAQLAGVVNDSLFSAAWQKLPGMPGSEYLNDILSGVGKISRSAALRGLAETGVLMWLSTKNVAGFNMGIVYSMLRLAAPLIFPAVAPYLVIFVPVAYLVFRHFYPEPVGYSSVDSNVNVNVSTSVENKNQNIQTQIVNNFQTNTSTLDVSGLLKNITLSGLLAAPQTDRSYIELLQIMSDPAFMSKFDPKTKDTLMLINRLISEYGQSNSPAILSFLIVFERATRRDVSDFIDFVDIASNKNAKPTIYKVTSRKTNRGTGESNTRNYVYNSRATDEDKKLQEKLADPNTTDTERYVLTISQRLSEAYYDESRVPYYYVIINSLNAREKQTRNIETARYRHPSIDQNLHKMAVSEIEAKVAESSSIMIRDCVDELAKIVRNHNEHIGSQKRPYSLLSWVCSMARLATNPYTKAKSLGPTEHSDLLESRFSVEGVRNLMKSDMGDLLLGFINNMHSGKEGLYSVLKGANFRPYYSKEYKEREKAFDDYVKKLSSLMEVFHAEFTDFIQSGIIFGLVDVEGAENTLNLIFERVIQLTDSFFEYYTFMDSETGITKIREDGIKSDKQSWYAYAKYWLGLNKRTAVEETKVDELITNTNADYIKLARPFVFDSTVKQQLPLLFVSSVMICDRMLDPLSKPVDFFIGNVTMSLTVASFLKLNALVELIRCTYLEIMYSDYLSAKFAMGVVFNMPIYGIDERKPTNAKIALAPIVKFTEHILNVASKKIQSQVDTYLDLVTPEERQSYGPIKRILALLKELGDGPMESFVEYFKHKLGKDLSAFYGDREIAAAEETERTFDGQYTKYNGSSDVDVKFFDEKPKVKLGPKGGSIKNTNYVKQNFIYKLVGNALDENSDTFDATFTGTCKDAIGWILLSLRYHHFGLDESTMQLLEGLIGEHTCLHSSADSEHKGDTMSWHIPRFEDMKKIEPVLCVNDDSIIRKLTRSEIEKIASGKMKYASNPSFVSTIERMNIVGIMDNSLPKIMELANTGKTSNLLFGKNEAREAKTQCEGIVKNLEKNWWPFVLKGNRSPFSTVIGVTIPTEYDYIRMLNGSEYDPLRKSLMFKFYQLVENRGRCDTTLFCEMVDKVMKAVVIIYYNENKSVGHLIDKIELDRMGAKIILAYNGMPSKPEDFYGDFTGPDAFTGTFTDDFLRTKSNVNLLFREEMDCLVEGGTMYSF